VSFEVTSEKSSDVETLIAVAIYKHMLPDLRSCRGPYL